MRKILTKAMGGVRKYTYVDDEDYEKVKKYKWQSILKGGMYYVRRGVKLNNKLVSIYLHRLIMNAPKGLCVDHINHNPLDNRKRNLRICTHKQNMYNTRKNRKDRTSKYKGVYFSKLFNAWGVCLNKDGRTYKKDNIPTEIEAVKLYNEKAKEWFGEFANLNKI